MTQGNEWRLLVCYQFERGSSHFYKKNVIKHIYFSYHLTKKYESYSGDATDSRKGKSPNPCNEKWSFQHILIYCIHLELKVCFSLACLVHVKLSGFPINVNIVMELQNNYQVSGFLTFVFSRSFCIFMLYLHNVTC